MKNVGELRQESDGYTLLVMAAVIQAERDGKKIKRTLNSNGNKGAAYKMELWEIITWLESGWVARWLPRDLRMQVIHNINNPDEKKTAKKQVRTR